MSQGEFLDILRGGAAVVALVLVVVAVSWLLDRL